MEIGMRKLPGCVANIFFSLVYYGISEETWVKFKAQQGLEEITTWHEAFGSYDVGEG